MQNQKKTDRNTKLTNLATKVNRVVNDAEQYALNAGVSPATLKTSRLEAEFAELLINQDVLNSELLTPNAEELSPRQSASTKRVTFASGVKDFDNGSQKDSDNESKSLSNPRPVIRKYPSENQDNNISSLQPSLNRRPVPPSFTERYNTQRYRYNTERYNTQRYRYNTERYNTERYNTERYNTEHYNTERYNTNQTDNKNNRENFIIMFLVLAVVLFLVANNGMQNNSTAPKLKP